MSGSLLVVVVRYSDELMVEIVSGSLLVVVVWIGVELESGSLLIVVVG